MKTYFAKDYNIQSNCAITTEFIQLLEDLRAESGAKTIIFEKGTYFLESKDCLKKTLNITNTIAEKEYTKDEEKRVQRVGIYLDEIDNLTIDFANSTVVIYGEITNVAILNCKNITIKNVEIVTKHPNLHEITVVAKTNTYVDYKIDDDSVYKKHMGKFYFTGFDYKLPFLYKVTKTWWVGDVKPESPDKIKRTFHPFLSSLYIKELEERLIRVYYFATNRFTVGEKFYLYDVRRKNVGIFIDSSKDIVLQNIKQRFNYSLAVVAQNTQNITIDSVDFSSKTLQMCSIADFVQICMCYGDVVIKNSNFEGAGDDCLNVHGFHFAVTKKEDNKIVVKFMHPQSYGFNPFNKDDIIAYINKDTLIEKGTSKVVDSKMLNDYEIELTIEGDLPQDNQMVENVTKNPNLQFVNNRLNRIITRGILVTTRGKVEILDNVFNNNSMSGILISDDASCWYESGMVKDVVIKNNTFNGSEEYDILIKPENSKYENYVHNNIVIINNTFNSQNGGGLYVKDSSIVFKDNIINEKDFKIVNKNSKIEQN